MEVRGIGVTIQQKEVGFRRKRPASVKQDLSCACQGNSLKLRRSFGIIEREFRWSVSESCRNVVYEIKREI